MKERHRVCVVGKGLIIYNEEWLLLRKRSISLDLKNKYELNRG